MMFLMSCSKDTSTIGHEDMAHIYAEMLMRDQWINSNYSERSKADTTFVYGTILEDFGYSREEFNESVAFYVDHPEVLNKIMDRCAQLLDGRRLVLENMIKQRDNFKTDSLARVKKIRRLDSIVHSVPAPHWDFSDSLYVPEIEEENHPSIWSEEEIKFQKASKSRAVLDSISQLRHRSDSLRADSLKVLSARLDSLRLDSLYVVFKGDSSAVRKFERERLEADSLLQVKERHLDSVLYGPLRKGFRPDPDVLKKLARQKEIADSLERRRADSLAVARANDAATAAQGTDEIDK